MAFYTGAINRNDKPYFALQQTGKVIPANKRKVLRKKQVVDSINLVGEYVNRYKSFYR
jgi:hypothetical protein